MKKVGLVILANLVFQIAFTQESHTSVLRPLLESYYKIKDALIMSDSGLAALEAKGFLEVMNNVDIKKLTNAEIGLYLPMNDELLLSSKYISETKNLTKQRSQFSAFSDNFYQLVKSLKLKNEPIYYVYCPMKRSYWLSNDKVIKNPYYGEKMLTCGKVVEVVTPK